MSTSDQSGCLEKIQTRPYALVLLTKIPVNGRIAGGHTRAATDRQSHHHRVPASKRRSKEPDEWSIPPQTLHPEEIRKATEMPARRDELDHGGDIPGKKDLFPGYQLRGLAQAPRIDRSHLQRDLQITPRKASISHDFLGKTPAPDIFLQ
jgi:hypothetical protein